MGWIIVSLVGLFFLLALGVTAFARDKEGEKKMAERSAKIVDIQKKTVEKAPEPKKKAFVPIVLKRVAKPDPKPVVKKEIIVVKKKNHSYYIQPWQSKDGWRFRIKHRNGNIIAGSEAYSTKQAMEKTLTSLTKQLDIKVIEKIEYKKI